MITNFNLFGIEHIYSLVIPVITFLIFTFLAKRFPNKKKFISISFAILIIIVRCVRYAFDISIGEFELSKVFSLHVCNIDLILLLICLIKPSKKLFTFCFLIGIPTALSVALMPGRIHPEPGMLRAIFFIMSHMLLAVAPIYLQITYKYKIEKKELFTYYIVSFVGIIVMYIFNIVTNSNYMYLVFGPEGTVLEKLYNLLGKYFYTLSIFGLLIILITVFYLLSKFINRIVKIK